MSSVLFYCQNVLGMGHFIRSAALIEGLQPHPVVFVNGGEPVPEYPLGPHVEGVQLPPLGTDAEFRDLHVGPGTHDLPSVQNARQTLLFQTLERVDPDLVIIELFPFGRKKFAFELLPLLARCRLRQPRPRVLCSVRDILVHKRDPIRHEARVCHLINRYFDAVLVHADPRLQRLEATFGRTADLTAEVIYTGYVAPLPSPVRALPEKDRQRLATIRRPLVVASIGGGRVGVELLQATVQASAFLYPTLPHELLVFTGPYLPEAAWHRLQALTDQQRHIQVRRFSPHFPTYLARADLSISMAGYNTCMNILTTGVPALVWPFSGGDNQEQRLRADRLERLGAVRVLKVHELHPERLAEVMQIAWSRRSGRSTLELDGVTHTAAYVNQLLAPSPAPRPAMASNGRAGSTDDGFLETSLGPVLERLQAEDRTVRLFLRDDDVDAECHRLHHLLDIALARQVPLNLELIPARLTEATSRLLKDVKRVHPRLLDLHQHGWQHVNHEATGRKCEFGPSRTYAQQYDDIARGKALLDGIFGDRMTPVFTPPWNRCAETTLRVLDDLGFQALSKDRGGRPLTGYRFREISVSLDLYRWKGGAILRPPLEIVRDLKTQLQEDRPIGLLLHHQVMDAAALNWLDRLLVVLRRYPVVRMVTLNDLLQQRVNGGESRHGPNPI